MSLVSSTHRARWLSEALPATLSIRPQFRRWLALAVVSVGLIAHTMPLSATQVDIELLSPRGVYFDDAGMQPVASLTTSPDGRFTMFGSVAPNIVPGVTDTNGGLDAFLYDRVSGTTEVISLVSGSNVTGDGFSLPIGISLDGRWILISSTSSNLIGGLVNPNRNYNIFVHDRLNHSTQLVTRAGTSTTVSSNEGAVSAQFSDDGNWVLYGSASTDVIAGANDANNADDLFLFNRQSGTTLLVSHALGLPLQTANAGIHSYSISGDGSKIAFSSRASNLAAGMTDAAGVADMFLFDRSTNLTTQLTRSSISSTASPNGSSSQPTISADGRWVLFKSSATDLVNGVVDTNANVDLFMMDRVTGATVLVSRSQSATSTPNGSAEPTDMSADGRFVLYYSLANNVVAGGIDLNQQQDVFLFDRVAATTTLLSRQLNSSFTVNGRSFSAGISADGRWSLFYSTGENISAGVTDTNARDDAFLFDRILGTSTLLSRSATIPTQAAAGGAFPTEISDDGRWIAFAGGGNDFIAGNIDPRSVNAYLLDRNSSNLRLLSRGFELPMTAEYSSSGPTISADGRWIYFQSNAQDLIPGVLQSGSAQLYLHDVSARSSTRVTHAANNAIGAADGSSTIGPATPDGEWLLYASSARNLVGETTDSNGTDDVFLFNRSSATNTLVSRAAGAGATANGKSTPIALSADGRWVLFQSIATNLVAGVQDLNNGSDVYLFDRDSSSVALVSHAAGQPLRTGNYYSDATGMSTNGRWVLFRSVASDLIDGISDSNNVTDVFVFDRVSGQIELVSKSLGVASTASYGARAAAISGDGRWVLFESGASDFVAGLIDNNNQIDAFLFDRDTATAVLVSRSSSNPLQTANGSTDAQSISATGEWILISSRSTNLVPGIADTNGTDDLFLLHRDTGEMTAVSKAAGTTAMANDTSYAQTMSTDGRWVMFSSRAGDLVQGATLPHSPPSIYLFDRTGASNTLISHAVGQPLTQANGASQAYALSADGELIAFSSAATDMIDDVLDLNDSADVFLARISLFADGFEASSGSRQPTSSPGPELR